VNLSIVMSMFAIGLVTSIHCVFMCGGLVMAYAVKGTEDGPWYRRLVPHLAYQGAKIVSYATVALILGGLVALLGKAFDIGPLRNWLQVVAGIYMVLLGISMTGKVKVLRHLAPRPPKFLIDALTRNRRKASADAAEGHASLATPLTFGLLTGLMPCAPLIAAQASAMATGSPVTGALAMIAFGLGTMPLMLVFGFASSLLSRQFQAKFQIVAALAVVIFGAIIFNRGLMLVGSPVTFDSARASIAAPVVPASGDSQYTKGADGVVEIPLTIENGQYAPNPISFPANTPIRLIVDRKANDACSKQLAIPKAGVLVDLVDNGITKVDVPAMPAGSYTLTCGMGMLSGSIVVGATAAGVGSGASPFLLPAILIALIAGSYFVYTWRLARRPAPALAPVAATGSNASRTGEPVRAAKGSSKGAPLQKCSSGSAQPATASPARLWGFQPVELVIGGSVIAIAIIIGLSSGGFFH